MCLKMRIVFSFTLLAAFGAVAESTVFACIPPQTGILEMLADDDVQIETLVPAGQQPHAFEPTAKQVMKLAAADAFFITGTLPFERRIAAKLQGARGLKIVDCSQGIELRQLEEGDHGHDHAHGHDHSHGHDHAHGEADPHYWLAPSRLVVMADTMRSALAEIEPDAKKDLDRRYEALRTQLAHLDARIAKRLEPFKGQKVLVFHPAFGYFLEEYGLEQLPIEVQGKTPSPKQIERIVTTAREHDIRAIFVQPQFDDRSARAIAKAIGGRVVVMDPLARDVVANLLAMSEKLEAALKTEDGGT